MGKHGIRELKDFIEAIFGTGLVIADHVKDGVSVGDVFGILNSMFGSQEFRDKIYKAIDGADKIPSEIADIDMNETMDLCSSALSFVPKLMELLKK